MDIKITIEAPGLVAAINSLAEALAGSKSGSTTVVNYAPEVTATAEEPIAQEVETNEEPDKSEPTPDPDPAPAPETTEPAPTVTLEEVRAKLAKLSQAGKQAQVKALITQFGASKLTEIPAEKYAELMAAAEAIG